MMFAVLFLLLFTAADGESTEKVCNYQDVINYLNLTESKELFSMTRPVKDHRQPSTVYLLFLLKAILDVREIDQTFVSHVRFSMIWKNEHISWNQEDFCGIKEVNLPPGVLWKPDITIAEMVEKDKTPPSPRLIIDSIGQVSCWDEQVVVCSCRMTVYYFPFDTQRCNISFKSVSRQGLFDDKLQLSSILGSSLTESLSRDVMQTYKWLFISLNLTKETDSRPMITYTITMKRRSVLYVVNFMLPVLFFLFMDLASFMISDTGGEKLGFKVTVLLAVTVMQLILNEILPSTSDRVPLIVVYCLGIFSMMMLSLLETILVKYLLEKDQSQSDDCGDKQDKVRTCNCLTGLKKLICCCCIYDVPTGETPFELQSVAKEESDRNLTEESHALDKVSDELRESKVKALSQILKKEEVKPGYWCKMVKTINRVFFACYVTVVIVFLVVIFSLWIP